MERARQFPACVMAGFDVEAHSFSIYAIRVKTGLSDSLPGANLASNIVLE
jgi:hypothetical protein